ncbi:MAG: class I SAM-dependent methyltransferase [Oligoflexus sp.]
MIRLDNIKNNALSALANDQEIKLGDRLCQEQFIQMGSLTLHLLSFTEFDEEVLESIDKNERHCPLYGQVWPASLALCQYLLELNQNGTLANSRAIELGCGLALPSLLAAKMGALVTATDNHPEVGGFVNLHRDLNNISAEKLQFFPLDFGQQHITVEKSTDQLKNDWDFIFCSDILYEPALYPDLIKQLIQLSGPQTQIVLSDPGRVGLGDFLSMIKDYGFMLRHQNCKLNDCQVLVFRKQQRASASW